MNGFSEKELKRIKRQCKLVANDMVKELYERYDAIWTARIRITPSLLEHGKSVVREINSIMPNLLVYGPVTTSTSDEIAQEYGFESEDELIQFLLDYKPRGPVREELYQSLLAQSLYVSDDYVGDVPF